MDRIGMRAVTALPHRHPARHNSAHNLMSRHRSCCGADERVAVVDGLMMDYPLTVPVMLRRAESLFFDREIVSRRPDGSLNRYGYGEMARRARQLALALQRLGLERGDRVATLCWNHKRHLEAYFGIPIAGGVLHTLNLRLSPDDVAYTINHAQDRFVIVDASLLPLFEQARPTVDVEQVIVIGDGAPLPEGLLEYDKLLDAERAEDWVDLELNELEAAVLCYTSGTTGRPKGVVYSHRAILLHSLVSGLSCTMGPSDQDTVLILVPMFHANAWGLPYTCTFVGAKQILPGEHLDTAGMAHLLTTERVTQCSAVPTVWLNLLQFMDRNPGVCNLSHMRVLGTGGQAMPEEAVRRFNEEFSIVMVTGWGMTETGPVSTQGTLIELVHDRYGTTQHYVKTCGRQVPLTELRVRSGDAVVPRDGVTAGELEVRGATVASSYFNDVDSAEKFTTDGWLRTGDVASIDAHGHVAIHDRAKDAVKSGGEWISSIALENALMAHPAVSEAAVIAVAHPTWVERPVAVVAFKAGMSATSTELREFIAPRFARWWLPDAFVFLPEIPKTSTGKFQKSALREQYHDVLIKQPGLALYDQAPPIRSQV